METVVIVTWPKSTLRSVTCVVHGVGEEVRALWAQAESSHRVTVAMHVVDQLVLPQVPHLCHRHMKTRYQRAHAWLTDLLGRKERKQETSQRHKKRFPIPTCVPQISNNRLLQGFEGEACNKKIGQHAGDALKNQYKKCKTDDKKGERWPFLWD